MTLPLTLDGVNALDREQFVEAFGWIFEHSPWVAERAWAERPFSSLDALYRAMVNRVAEATREEQLALLRAHPDLGTRAKLSAASQGEQAGVGLDSLTAEEFERFSALSAAYRVKFGFPFLFAVKGSTKHDILLAMEERLLASYDGEFDEALRQMYRIAGFRLELSAGV
jgi:2-oxo-4-hydroxy-4-carboxy-5-ureidoimidazoline decarboxylase